jgi:lipopolysaccharide/colanic/teichoic acid biosynthesis glycosyltransferase
MKRIIDFVLAIIGLLFTFPVLIIVASGVRLLTGSPVLFKQKRIGREGRLFVLYKFRTMVYNAEKMEGGSVTIQNDLRTTSVGRFLRKWKLDELPTLWNVLRGDMSFVGPRPDVSGYADKLKGNARLILKMRPGITGPATLKYANEEQLLAKVDDPIKYNDEVIFPDKVRINLDYFDNWSLRKDMEIILKSIFRANY